MLRHTDAVDYGNSVSIGCNISNAPVENEEIRYEVVWMKSKNNQNYEELSTSDEDTAKYQGSTIRYPHLIIREADKMDDAYYYCCLKYKTSKGAQSVKSDVIHLSVNKGKYRRLKL